MPDIFVAKKNPKAEDKPARNAPSIAGAGGPALAALEEKHCHSKSPFPSLLVRPRNIRFETQESEEKIVLLLRRHMITNLSWVLQAILMILLPHILLRIIDFGFIPTNFRLIGLLAWTLFSLAFVFEKFLSWFFNANIITDERVIDINFPSILFKQISETKIDKIQEISVRTGGFIRTLFNYGDVVIQTAGEIPEICFEEVPNPSQVSVVLNEMIREEEQEAIDGRTR